MNKEEAVRELKNKLLEEINKYENNKQKKKQGRPKSLTYEECLDAFFLCSY